MSISTVSVIMNTYKEKPEYLREAVVNYVKQKNVYVHLIISTVEGDPSIKYVEALKKKEFPAADIQFCISTKKEHPGKGCLGIYYQLNKATAFIKGEWFCYASSNDVPVNNKLRTEIDYCQRSSKLVCYSSYATTNANLKNIKLVKIPPFNYLNLLKSNFVSDCSLVRSDILKEFLPFRTNYYNCGYWDLWLRIYSKYGNVFVLNPNISFLYRLTPESNHIKREVTNKKRLYNLAKLNLSKEAIGRSNLYKQAHVKSPDRGVSGLYVLTCRGNPFWMKKGYRLMRYKNGDWRILYQRKEIANSRRGGTSVLWKYRITSPNQL